MRRTPRRGIPWFRFGRVPYGTVYLFQAKHRPGLFKVGTTRRRTTVRRGEVSRGSGEEMRVVYTLQMPWAYVCEQAVLRSLRWDWGRRRDRRGTEWFWLRHGESLEQVIVLMERAAVRVSWSAYFRMSWPKGARVRSLRAGARVSRRSARRNQATMRLG